MSTEIGGERSWSGTWAALPLVPLALAFAAGIAASAWVPGWAAWSAWAAASAIVVVAITAPSLGGRVLVGGTISAVCILVAVGALGTLRAAPAPLAPDHIARLALPVQAEVVGRLAVSPTAAPGRVRLLVDVELVDGERRSGRLQLTA